MFARKACYFFVRPKKSALELCIFLGRPVKAPQIRRVDRTSRTKLAHIVQVRHRDEVEGPLVEWLREAYALQDAPAAPLKATRKPAKKPETKTAKAKPKRKATARSKPKRKASNPGTATTRKRET
jgi:hypothetical protein